VAVVQWPGAVAQEDTGDRGAAGSDREHTGEDGEHRPRVAFGGGDAIAAQRRAGSLGSLLVRGDCRRLPRRRPGRRGRLRHRHGRLRVGETLLSPAFPAIINDLAPPQAAGRYNGLGTEAFTVGFLLGPAAGTAALGAGWGSSLFTALVLASLIAAGVALRLGRHLPPAANHIPAPRADD
jgi:MFS family permease